MPLGEVPTPYPFFLAVPQATTESILYAELDALGRAPLGGHRDATVTERGGRYLVTGADCDGEPLRVRARHLVGADGLHSTVRDALGIGFVGRTCGTIFRTADVRLGVDVGDVAYVFPSRHGPLFMTPLVDGMWRLIVSKRRHPGTRPVPPSRSDVISPHAPFPVRSSPNSSAAPVSCSITVSLHHSSGTGRRSSAMRRTCTARTLALAGMGRIPTVSRRIALTVSCVSRTPGRTGAPALLGH